MEETASRRSARRQLRLACLTAALLAILAAAPAAALAGQVPSDTPAPTVKARSGILIDRRSGKTLWTKSPDLKLGPASCTKIMTALLVLEHYRDLSRYVTAPAAVKTDTAVAIGLRPGDRITVGQALYALMVKSASDAAFTLAGAVSGSERAFVVKMNRRARQLGLTRTRFVNCRGRPVPGHYTTARDLAKLGRFAMRDARFRRIVATQTATIRWPPSHAVTVTSHNRLLNYPWGDGIKTGATGATQKVLVGSGTPGPLAVPLIVVTMREPTRDQEEHDAIALLSWGEALYENRALVASGDVVRQLSVSDGTVVAAVAKTSLSAVVRKAATVTPVYKLQAEPLASRPADGSPLGSVTYRSDGMVLGTVTLVAGPVPAASPGQ